MIQLDENERKIVNAVRDYANSRNPPTVARFAGGWVRDKIMGLSSHDIDVALDNTSGYVFATGLSERLLLEEYSEKTLENTEELLQGPSVHKIQANPDKSKHLETAVVCICGISIDFANLRSEKYAEGRIPTIQPGTPLEDALRRDLTINSLFYNLNTEEIEDYTGKGLGDIEKRVIRTPLDPKVTLLEDPLRILRIFRFKAKMGFTIDPSIYEALELPNIRSALRNKVSIERINVELFKMLDYESGWVGMIEIIRTGYGPIIFAPGCDKEVVF
ncbi:tRNA nucleotidyltransferase (CCA-adding enzyme) [Pancytospora epiphaga]|nr:tRNA nucleotidyltransferase (CCA-adding enzyme) [Pancytospora epiphaga]